MPALWALSGCSIFIASSTTTSSPASTWLTLLDGDLDDRALHRAGQGVAGRGRAGLALGRRGVGAARRGRRRRRHRPEPGREHDLQPLAARPRRSPARAARRLGVVGSCAVERRDGVVELGLDPPGVHRERLRRVRRGRTPGRRRRRGGTGSPWACRRSRTRPARGVTRSSACCRSRPVTISLAISESNACGTVSPTLVAAVEPDAGTGRRAHRGDGPGCGHEAAAGVLGVDPELDRVAAQRRVVVAELLAVGDPEHLAHEVDAGDLLGDRVLDLQPGVDLEERDRAVLSDEELAGAGADVAGLAQDRLARPGAAAAPAPSERNGAGASSTSFWWRRCSEQSRVETTTTLPCWSARHWVSTWRGLVEEPLDEALAASEGGDRLADRGVVQLGDLLEGAGHLQPASATAVGGLDRDRQAVLLGERDDLVGAGHRVGRARDQRGARPAGRCAGPAPCRRGRRWPRAAGRSR